MGDCISGLDWERETRGREINQRGLGSVEGPSSEGAFKGESRTNLCPRLLGISELLEELEVDKHEGDESISAVLQRPESIGEGRDEGEEVVRQGTFPLRPMLFLFLHPSLSSSSIKVKED